ncbi:hypothetical protein NUW58_g620 [Xylaria curta]|uniref:Uncharacterized protein n=1 Tax=Xylaria curta TaxID=42375 RepID=A0ACC1PRB4_9PEZI|nr:hypothetical protein NUW58_g620 [Xylaria curta]
MEVALTFAASGAKGVLFADLNYDGAARAAEQSKALAKHPAYRCQAAMLDVTDSRSVLDLADLAVQSFGRIDYFINAVGLLQVDCAEYVPFEQTQEDDYDRILNINAKGAFLLSQAVVNVMRSQDIHQIDVDRHGTISAGRGAIVNVSSAMAFGAVPAKAPYTASKHAMLGLTRACAMDCKPYDIRVNQVCPAWTKTKMHEDSCRKEPLTPMAVEKMAARHIPMETYEVASACLYLCSPAAVSITGTSLMMDCGLTIGPTF